MASVLFVLAAGCLFGALGFALVALFARDDGVAWSRVAAAVVPDPLRARVAGPQLRAPDSGAPAAWFAAWVSETARRPDGDTAGASIAAFERSQVPLELDVGGAPVTVDPAVAWVESTGEPVPFGAADAHRALERWPGRRTVEAWKAAPPGRERDQWLIREVLLEPGAEIEVHGVREGGSVRPATGAEGVLVLRAGGEVAAGASARACAAGATRSRRVRLAGLLAAGFLVFAVAGGALA